VVKTVLLGAVLVATSTSSAFADPISITPFRRIVGSALVDIPGLPVVGDHFEQIDTSLGSFNIDRTADAAIGHDSAASAASQHSTLTAARWFGSSSTAASATGDVGLNVGGSISAVGVNFSIAEPTRYLFRGSVGSAGESQAVLTLFGSSFRWQDGFGLPAEDQVPNFRTAQVRHDGVLQPGAYDFFATADSIAGLADRTTPARAILDFDFRFTPTPEPTSGLLVGAALLAFVYRRSLTTARE
jgi:hypothetical protein